MARTKDAALEQHQHQCDYRYVSWLGLAGMLLVFITVAGGLGWSAARTLSRVEVSQAALSDSLVAVSVITARHERDIEALKARARILDSLNVWVPRIERTAIATQQMVRRWGR